MEYTPAAREEVVYSWGGPLRACATSGRHAMAETLLAYGATPDTNVCAATSAMCEAYAREDHVMVQVLERHGGGLDAMTIGYRGLTEKAKALLDDEAAGRLREGAVPAGQTAAEVLLLCGADNGDVEIVGMALDCLHWPRGDVRWHGMLMRPFGAHAPDARERYLTCFRMMLERSGADVRGGFGRTVLHDVAAAWPRTAMGPDERVAFATTLLDAGAPLDVRDDLLKSTPLGWACRWGRVEMVTLLLERGADALEPDAEPWATPRAWAGKMHRQDVLAVLRTHVRRSP